MAHSDTHAVASGSAWGGGVAPYGIGSKKLGMWLFIFADSLTFGACLIAYSWVRLASPEWPRPFDTHSIVNALIMTACLLSSSLTMVLGVAAAHRNDRRSAVRWVLAQAPVFVNTTSDGTLVGAVLDAAEAAAAGTPPPNDAEMAAGETAWLALPDPLPPWDLAACLPPEEGTASPRRRWNR